MTNAAQFTTPEQAKAHRAAYEQMLVDRYRAGLAMSRWDKADARRIIRARGEKV